MERRFYTTKGSDGYLSNFYRAPFVAGNNTWRTSEHYYQAQKALYEEDFQRILSAASPKEAARIGRSIDIRPDWDDIKTSVMLRALNFKFRQNPSLREKLLSTGDDILIEDTVGTPRADPIWGTGANGEGQNLLGKLLMVVRSDLRSRYG